MENSHRKVRYFTCFGVHMLGNTDNGCIVGLNEEGVSLWKLYERGLIGEATFASRDPDLFSALQSHDFFGTSRSEAGVKTSYIHITQRCNLSCKGCYSKQNQLTEDLELSDIKKMIDYLRRSGVATVHISGGEPFLRPDLSLITEYAKEIGIKYVDVITNGTMDRFVKLSDLAPYIDLVNVSIGACSDNDEGSIKGGNLYHKVMTNIQSMLDAGITVCLLPTIHSRNIDDIPRYVDLANELGVQINFSILTCSACNRDLGQYAFDKDSLSKLAAVLINMFKQTERLPLLVARRSCQAGVRQISLDAQGNIYPCHMLHSPIFKMGSALARSEVDRRLHSSELTELIDFDVENDKDCGVCSYRYICGGGCRTRTYSHSNSIEGADPYCALLKAYFNASLLQLTR